MHKNIGKLVVWSFIPFLLLACKQGGDTRPLPEETLGGPDTLTLIVSEENDKKTLEPGAEPTAQQDTEDDGTRIVLPATRDKSSAQALLESNVGVLPPIEFYNYQTLLPHPELFCEPNQSKAFLDIAENLGGFVKGSRILIEPDASTPRLLDGIEPAISYVGGGEASNTPSPSSDAVTIERPNIVGRAGNKAFYLSQTYGLIVVDFSDPQAIKTSCAMSLPGRPKNFLVVDDSLIVLIASLDNKHSAIMQLTLQQTAQDNEEALSYKDAIYFENMRLLDARLFNSTLALYLEEGQPPVAVTNSSVSYAPTTKLSYQLKIVSSQPSLAVTHTEVFLIDEDNPDEDKGNDYWYSYFNSFLSASGEYLIVSEVKTHSYISHYETRQYNRCIEHVMQETPYHYCKTLWKRVENPDYEPPGASGVVACSGDLLQCLQNRGPKLPRYIYVPDGQDCKDGVRKRFICTARRYESYQVPVYANDVSTHLNVYRFVDGSFTKLDNSLALLQGDSLISTDVPLQISGRVQKHDHLRFNNSQLYIISSSNGGKSHYLNTLAVVGNAVVHVDQRLLMETQNYANLTATLTASNIYVSESSYRYNASLQWSEMQLVSLENPLKPALSNTARVPSHFDQLLFSQNSLIGIGRVIMDNGFFTSNLGNITSFTATGSETGSLLLGADYQYYYANVRSDDQLVTLDTGLNRIMIPYQVRTPVSDVNAAPSLNRFTLADITEDGPVEAHTFDLPRLPRRSLSINQDLAFSFNDVFIHGLQKNTQWQAKALFDGELPESIYYARQYPVQTQKVSRADRFLFKLINSDEGASGELLDSLNVAKASSNYCVSERVYFDNDRILIVREKTGLYFSYQDCEENLEDRQLERIGYRIGASSFSIIDDQQELAELHQRILWDLQCILDLENRNGTVVDEFPEGSAEATCLTRSEYDQLRYNTPSL